MKPRSSAAFSFSSKLGLNHARRADPSLLKPLFSHESQAYPLLNLGFQRRRCRVGQEI